MQVFDIGPGKEIGLIKIAVREAILEGSIRNDFESGWPLMIKEGEALGLYPVFSLEEFLKSIS
jgi:hypothetical protein